MCKWFDINHTQHLPPIPEFKNDNKCQVDGNDVDDVGAVVVVVVDDDDDECDIVVFSIEMSSEGSMHENLDGSDNIDVGGFMQDSIFEVSQFS